MTAGPPGQWPPTEVPGQLSARRIPRWGCVPLLFLPAFVAVTDAEYDILDELYFVTSFRDLSHKTGLPASELAHHLRSLLEQGLVRSFWPDPDTELAYEESSFGAISQDSFYLASKEGLLQHNTR